MAPTKTNSKKSETAPVAEVKATKATKSASTKAEAPAAEVKPAKKATKAEKQEVKPKQEEVKPAETSAPSEKKERRVVSKESLNTDFETLLTKISTEIERLREAKPKAKGVKFLKTLNKDIKQLHSDCNRVTKFKKNGERKASTSSGFLKPVNISPELAKFTGWDSSKPYSRTQVTKFICNYIKTNKLYDEKDKRNIMCDAKLKNLLKYDPANPPKDENGAVQALTYFRLQQYLKGHFKAIAAAVEEDLE